MTVLRDRFNKDRSDLPNVVFTSGDNACVIRLAITFSGFVDRIPDDSLAF